MSIRYIFLYRDGKIVRRQTNNLETIDATDAEEQLFREAQAIRKEYQELLYKLVHNNFIEPPIESGLSLSEYLDKVKKQE